VRLSQSAKIHYPYHPMFGRELEIFGGAGGQRDVIYVLLPDRTTRGIPGWMFDEVVCSSVRTANQPTIDGGALIRLAQLLDLFNEGRRTGDDDNKTSFQVHAKSLATSITSSSAVGIGSASQTNPVHEPNEVRPVASRTTGDGRPADQTQPRRPQ
jgi:hypothetical protein